MEKLTAIPRARLQQGSNMDKNISVMGERTHSKDGDLKCYFIGHSHQTDVDAVKDPLLTLATISFGRNDKNVSRPWTHVVTEAQPYVDKALEKSEPTLHIKLYGCEFGQKIVNNEFSPADLVRLNLVAYYMKKVVAAYHKVSDVAPILSPILNNPRPDEVSESDWQALRTVIQTLLRHSAAPLTQDAELRTLSEITEQTYKLFNSEFCDNTLQTFTIKCTAPNGTLSIKENKDNPLAHDAKYVINESYLSNLDNAINAVKEIISTAKKFEIMIKMLPYKDNKGKSTNISITEFIGQLEQNIVPPADRKIVIQSLLETFYQQMSVEGKPISMNKFFMANLTFYKENCGFTHCQTTLFD